MTRNTFIKLGNFMLCVLYALGSLVILFPNEQSVIPHNMGYVSVGVLLLATAIFGSPYCVGCD
jgi:hypothetical protein